MKRLVQEHKARREVEAHLSNRLEGARGLMESRQMALRAPRQRALRAPGQPALRAPGQTALRAPGQMALRAPGQPALRAPGQTALRASGQSALRAAGSGQENREVHKSGSELGRAAVPEDPLCPEDKSV